MMSFMTSICCILLLCLVLSQLYTVLPWTLGSILPLVSSGSRDIWLSVCQKGLRFAAQKA